MKDLQLSKKPPSVHAGKRKIVIRSPARTCLFGDHQDYMGLPVIACAIDRHIVLTAVQNELGIFKLDLLDIAEKREIDIAAPKEPIAKGDHFLTALKVLRKYGCIPVHGFDITITGNIPINAGTSSSSAIVVAWVRFLIEAFKGSRFDAQFVAQVAYEVEVLEQGSPGGKMDQYSIGLGNIIYLETGEVFNYELIQKPLPGLIVGESGIAKKTNETLQELKDGAWDAIRFLKEKHTNFDIAKVRPQQVKGYLNELPDLLQPYFYAAVNNHDLTKRALDEFRKDTVDLSKIGMLMTEHHNILKNILRITLPKIDSMIDAALKAGAYGAKIVGSGRGGSIVAIAPLDKQENVIEEIKRAGGKNAYAVAVDPGVKVL